MRLLLDTHIVVWALTDRKELSARSRQLLANPDNEFWVSSASVWELAIKVSMGKLHVPFTLESLESELIDAGFRLLNVTPRHAIAIERVKLDHGDPFDRLLLAQCEVETLRFLTADSRLARLPVSVPH